MTTTLSEKHFVGGWQLTSFFISFSDGAPAIYPFGEQARGQLLYTADGQMSAILCPVSRHFLEVSDLESSRHADVSQKVAAFDSYMSYAGRWSLDGDAVTHHVDFALVPDLVGHRHVRHARFDEGGSLTLTYEKPTRRGTRACYTLRWVRAAHTTPARRSE